MDFINLKPCISYTKTHTQIRKEIEFALNVNYGSQTEARVFVTISPPPSQICPEIYLSYSTISTVHFYSFSLIPTALLQSEFIQYFESLAN